MSNPPTVNADVARFADATSLEDDVVEAARRGDQPTIPAQKYKVRIAHKVAGRIRMRIPSAKSNPEILEVYQKAFSAIPGIIKVNAKPTSGSIVIHYDPKREGEFDKQFAAVCAQNQVAPASPLPGDEVERIAEKIKAEAEFLAQRSEFAKASVEFFRQVDHQLKLTTENTIDLKIVLAGGLAAFTFWEIGAEAATPMWVTLALFSMNHFVELHNNPPAAVADPKGAS